MGVLLTPKWLSFCFLPPGKPEMLTVSQRMLKISTPIDSQAKFVFIPFSLKYSCHVSDFCKVLEGSIKTAPSPPARDHGIAAGGMLGPADQLNVPPGPAPDGTQVPSTREVAGLTFHLCFLLGGCRRGRCGRCGRWVHPQTGRWVILPEPHLGK